MASDHGRAHPGEEHGRAQDQSLVRVQENATKVLTNAHENDQKELTVKGQKVEILPSSGSTMYLGRLLSMESPHDTELGNRIRKAWAKCMTWKKELCGKSYPLKDRLRLFNATVTPTVLYGCGCWAMTDARERKLRTTQRRMLRWIVGIGRRKATNREGGEAVNKKLEEGGEISSETASEQTQEESREESSAKDHSFGWFLWFLWFSFSLIWERRFPGFHLDVPWQASQIFPAFFGPSFLLGQPFVA